MNSRGIDMGKHQKPQTKQAISPIHQIHRELNKKIVKAYKKGGIAPRV